MIFKLEIVKAKLKSESDVEIEKLKSKLNIAAAERSLRFSNLQDRRATAIAAVYASLKPFLDAMADYVNLFEAVGGPSRTERGSKAVKAGNAFIQLYSAKKIFIPKEIAKKIDEMNDQLKSAHIGFAYLVDLPPEPDRDQWVEIYNKIKNISDTAVKDLEDDFRRLLGDDSA